MTATSRTIDWTDSCRCVGSVTSLRTCPGGHENDNDDEGDGHETRASTTTRIATTAMAFVLDVAVMDFCRSSDSLTMYRIVTR